MTNMTMRQCLKILAKYLASCKGPGQKEAQIALAELVRLLNKAAKSASQGTQSYKPCNGYPLVPNLK